MKINNIDDAKKIFSQLDTKIYGIGITAYMRILPAMFLGKNFQIICYKDSLDNRILEKFTKIHSLQLHGEVIKKLSSYDILTSNYVKNIFSNQKNINLYVYKTSKEIEDFAEENGYNIIGNKNKIREKYENKKTFREILSSLGVEPIKGENIEFQEFMKKEYSDFSSKYSSNFVIQLPDIKIGGGLGTIFISSEKDFLEFKDKIKEQTYRNTLINSLNITKFIKGISASITGCATKFGTLTGKVQTQILDIPEIVNLKKGSGVFCGHDWSYKIYSDKINNKAQKITKKLGKYMYENGYKGIFGLDLIVDEESDDVCVVECNSRYTGAFPMTSLIDLKEQVIPMDIFHIFEFLDVDYEIDYEEINKKYNYNKTGSHIVLSNINDDEILIKKDLKPGLYKFELNSIIYVGEGFSYLEINNDNEFIIIDGNPKAGEKISGGGELSRFCHLLFPISIIENQNTLNELTKKLVEEIYDNYT